MKTLRQLIDRLDEIEHADDAGDHDEPVAEDSVVYDDGSDPAVGRKRRAAREVEQIAGRVR